MLKISVKSKKDLDPDSDDDSIYYSFGSKLGILALFRLFEPEFHQMGNVGSLIKADISSISSREYR